MTVNVRSAVYGDLPALVEMAQLMHAESPYFSRVQFSAEKLRATLLRMINNEVPGRAFIAMSQDGPIGMAAVVVYEHLFSVSKTATDFAVYVLPACRGSRVGVKLVRALEHAAMELGAQDITLGVSTEVETERTAEMYACLGYRRKGISMVKELHV